MQQGFEIFMHFYYLYEWTPGIEHRVIMLHKLAQLLLWDLFIADKKQSGETGAIGSYQAGLASASILDKSQDAGSKPKIQKIVWVDPNSVPLPGVSGISTSQPVQTMGHGGAQQLHPVRGGLMRGRSSQQQSNRGGYQHGQRRPKRGRGSMGRHIRRPPMYWLWHYKGWLSSAEELH